ncbi:hypothetical protein DID88_003051 [Monilinia fructigena]|uniref:Uncharacterized protein n=1 Tax=Monilinia fructigena TaxID=38457 RepID=A0A395IEF8_9HELO|nr:hypothetical protein DID88_003051 [Monilinia fructigena]
MGRYTGIRCVYMHLFQPLVEDHHSHIDSELVVTLPWSMELRLPLQGNNVLKEFKDIKGVFRIHITKYTKAD